MDYADMPTKELVDRHNELAALTGDNQVASWKKSKSLLVDRIREMEGRLGENTPELEDDTDESIDAIAEATDDEFERAMAGEPVSVPDEAQAALETITDAERETLETDDRPTRTIREASLDWLCHVDHYEDKTKKSGPDNRVPADHSQARSVGLPYLSIIDAIKEEFPGAQTSVACLRWYAVKVRVEEFGYEGYKLVQRRPRAKPSK